MLSRAWVAWLLSISSSRVLALVFARTATSSILLLLLGWTVDDEVSDLLCSARSPAHPGWSAAAVLSLVSLSTWLTRLLVEHVAHWTVGQHMDHYIYTHIYGMARLYIFLRLYNIWAALFRMTLAKTRS